MNNPEALDSFLEVLLSFVITLVAYGFFPLVFAKTRSKPITKLGYSSACYLFNLFVLILFVIIASSNGVPYVLWTWLFSIRGKKILDRRCLLKDKAEIKRLAEEKKAAAAKAAEANAATIEINTKTSSPAPKEDVPEKDAPKETKPLSKTKLVAALPKIAMKPRLQKRPASHKYTYSSVPTITDADIENYLKRARFFLEDGEFENADVYAEAVLNRDPENAQAYFIKFMTAYRLRSESDILSLHVSAFENPYFKKALRFSEDEPRARLNEFISKADTINAENKKDAVYFGALKHLEGKNLKSIKRGIAELKSISGWRDADKLIETAESNCAALLAKAKNRKKALAITIPSALFITLSIAGVLVYKSYVVPLVKYEEAVELMNASDYSAAEEVLCEIIEFRDSYDLLMDCITMPARDFISQRRYREADGYLDRIEGYSTETIEAAKYKLATDLLANDDTTGAYTVLRGISDYLDSADLMHEIEVINPLIIYYPLERVTGVAKPWIVGSPSFVGNTYFDYCDVFKWTGYMLQETASTLPTSITLRSAFYHFEWRDRFYYDDFEYWVETTFYNNAFSAAEKKYIEYIRAEPEYYGDWGISYYIVIQVKVP